MPALKNLLKARQLPGVKIRHNSWCNCTSLIKSECLACCHLLAPLTPQFAIDANLSTLESSFISGWVSEGTPDDDRMDIDDDEGVLELEISKDGGMCHHHS